MSQNTPADEPRIRTLFAYALYNWETRDLRMGRYSSGSPEPEEGEHLYRFSVNLPAPDDIEEDTILKSDWLIEEWATKTPPRPGQSIENYMLRRIAVHDLVPPHSFGPGNPCTTTCLDILPPQRLEAGEEPRNTIRIGLDGRTYEISVIDITKED